MLNCRTLITNLFFINFILFSTPYYFRHFFDIPLIDIFNSFTAHIIRSKPMLSPSESTCKIISLPTTATSKFSFIPKFTVPRLTMPPIFFNHINSQVVRLKTFSHSQFVAMQSHLNHCRLFLTNGFARFKIPDHAFLYFHALLQKLWLF